MQTKHASFYMWGQLEVIVQVNNMIIFHLFLLELQVNGCMSSSSRFVSVLKL